MRYNNDGLSFLIKLSKHCENYVAIPRIKTARRLVC